MLNCTNGNTNFSTNSFCLNFGFCRDASTIFCSFSFKTDNDQTDPDYQEMIQIFNQCDTYQRSVLLATGRALLKKKPLENDIENI